MKKVLIITADDYLISAIREIVELEELPLHICFAVNGIQGLERLNSMTSLPDFIISDNIMPGLSGADLLKKLRDGENPNFANIPVILMTVLSHYELEDYLTLHIGAVRPDKVLQKSKLAHLPEMIQPYLA